MSAGGDGGGEGGNAPPPSCGAKLRTGGACALPPAAGKRRCFQHGGARGIGAPTGNRNNWRDGFYGREEMAARRRINGFIRECLERLREAKELAADGEGEGRPAGTASCRRE